MNMTPDKIFALFEKGDNPKSASDVAYALGIRRGRPTPELRRMLERLAADGKLVREVCVRFETVYNEAFGPVFCQRKRAFYSVV